MTPDSYVIIPRGMENGRTEIQLIFLQPRVRNQKHRRGDENNGAHSRANEFCHDFSDGAIWGHSWLSCNNYILDWQSAMIATNGVNGQPFLVVGYLKKHQSRIESNT
jgi:hypothetical protein